MTLSPELQKVLDKLNAEQDAKRKIEWDAAESQHFPKPDVTRYVSNIAEFERLVKKYSNKSIREQWVYRTDELMEEGMTFDDASKIAWREGTEVEAANPVDLMSMAVGGDIGCPIELPEHNIIHTDPKYNAATSSEEIQKKIDAYENATR